MQLNPGYVTAPLSLLEASDARSRVFSTDTLFRGNEYTVLGASGMDPIFVVIRVAPMGA